MNVITDTWKALIRRKLWPVALLLVGALVAVPLVLAKSPEAGTPAANASAVSKDDAMPATFVSAADETAAGDETAKRRRTLGAQKDPFEPAPLPKAKKSKKAKADATATPTPEASTDPGTGSAGAGGTATPPAGAEPTATPAPTVTVPAYSVRVRFGSTEGEELPASTIERLSVLPDKDNPLVVYRGVEDGGKVAIFELTGDVTAEGDGTCAPTPEDCQYVKLRPGETEFITIKAAETGSTDAPADTEPQAQFELDLVKIYKKKTKVKATDTEPSAAQSLAKAASSSLKGKKRSSVQLRRRNRYVFDATTGTLHRAKNGAKTPLSSL
jgi:hypothetical protein